MVRDSHTVVVVTVWKLLLLFSFAVCRGQERCQQKVNCHLPKCFCPNKGVSGTAPTPADLLPIQVPQIVAFSFDDAINVLNFGIYNRLFPPTAKNPNGCPISATFFVSHNFTDYSMVKSLYDRGMEIAAHSVTHRTPSGFWKTISREDMLYEATKWKQIVSEKAGIPADRVYGWRFPFLQPGGDTAFEVLQEVGFEYDATLLASGNSARTQQQWPYTLDFGYPFRCQIPSCPRKQYSEFWEVPVVPLQSEHLRFSCTYLDSCFVPLSTKEQTLDILLKNFMANYKGRREPLYINLHSSFFAQAEYRFEALQDFINIILHRCDVYIVSLHHVIDWMRQPTPWNELLNFKPWQCPQ